MTKHIKGSAGLRNKVLLDLYKPRLMEQFKNHPRGPEIVEMMCQGDNPPELIDLWFAEAEMYSWEKLRNWRPTVNNVNKDGNIVIPIHGHVPDTFKKDGK